MSLDYESTLQIKNIFDLLTGNKKHPSLKKITLYYINGRLKFQTFLDCGLIDFLFKK